MRERKQERSPKPLCSVPNQVVRVCFVVISYVHCRSALLIHASHFYILAGLGPAIGDTTFAILIFLFYVLCNTSRFCIATRCCSIHRLVLFPAWVEGIFFGFYFLARLARRRSCLLSVVLLSDRGRVVLPAQDNVLVLFGFSASDAPSCRRKFTLSTLMPTATSPFAS